MKPSIPIKTINDRIKSIWAAAKREETGLYAPQFYEQPSPGCFLTIGINPSLPQRRPSFFPGGEQYPEFFLMPKIVDDNYINRLINLELMARGNYHFYSKFREIKDSLESPPWHHVDLFFIRNRSQNDFKKAIYKNGKSLPLTDFANKQLSISSELISLCKPKCILVANALASDLFIECLKDKFPLIFNESKGFYTTCIGSNQVPIFFSSQLTGGRLDNYSFERLKWHIGKAWRQ